MLKNLLMSTPGKVAVGVLALVLATFGTAFAAEAGGLPASVQDAVAGAAHVIGIDLPDSQEAGSVDLGDPNDVDDGQVDDVDDGQVGDVDDGQVDDVDDGQVDDVDDGQVDDVDEGQVDDVDDGQVDDVDNGQVGDDGQVDANDLNAGNGQD